MVKKLLFILIILSSAIGFAQNSDAGVVASKQQTQGEKSITNLSASPNPMMVKSSITFESTVSQIVIFEVKNILGKSVVKQKVQTTAGLNEINFLKDNLPAGMYLYSIQTDSEILTKRLVIK